MTEKILGAMKPVMESTIEINTHKQENLNNALPPSLSSLPHSQSHSSILSLGLFLAIDDSLFPDLPFCRGSTENSTVKLSEQVE